MKRVMMAPVLLLLIVSLAVPAVGAAGFPQRHRIQEQTAVTTCPEGCRIVDGNGDGRWECPQEKAADRDPATCRKGGFCENEQVRSRCRNGGHCGRR